MEHIAIAASTKNDRMTSVGCKFTVDEVTHHHAFAAFLTISFCDNQIHHFVVSEDFHSSQVDLALQG